MDGTCVHLFTRREYAQKPGLLRRISDLITPQKEATEKHMVYAEELFTDIIGKFWNLNIQKKYDTESVTVEDPFGTYPCLTIHKSFIGREYIIQYFKQVTTINDWLTVPQLRTCEWYEQLVMTKLNLVTRTLLYKGQEPFAFGMLSYLISPFRTYSKYTQLKNFTACCSTTIGCSTSMTDKNNMQWYDIANEIYEKLSKPKNQNNV